MLGEALSFVTGPIGAYWDKQANKNAADHAARMNYAQQKEFAQSGIQWKVEDAKKAGIHPLAALGASTPTTGGTHTVGGGGSDLGSSLASMGQSVGRAIQASSSADQRMMTKLQIQNAQTELTGKELDNAIKQSTLQKMNQVGPAFPSATDAHMIEGQGDAQRGVRLTPSESVASHPGRPGVQAGSINSLQYAREADGGITVVPSQQMKERIEDDFIGETMWHLKNRVIPPPPPRDMFPPPPGSDGWLWSPGRQKFVPNWTSRQRKREADAKELFNRRYQNKR